MARDNRIGPYMDQWKVKNDDGFNRVTLNEFRSSTVFSVEAELAALSSDGSDRYAPGLLSEFRDVVVGERRPVDRAIKQMFFHTDMRYWAENHLRWMPAYPHRVVVRAHITTKDNLSVTLSPECLSEQGEWDHAREWKSDPFSGYGGFRARPMNEVLFLRGVSHLFCVERGRVSRTPERQSAEARAVLMAFWLAMDRLSSVFEIHYANYIAGLTRKEIMWGGEDEPLAALEIVDALPEYRSILAGEITRFKVLTGYTPDEFYSLCSSSDHRGYEAISKKIRWERAGVADLVPSVVRDLHSFLVKAKAYGIWRPKA